MLFKTIYDGAVSFYVENLGNKAIVYLSDKTEYTFEDYEDSMKDFSKNTCVNIKEQNKKKKPHCWGVYSENLIPVAIFKHEKIMLGSFIKNNKFIPNFNNGELQIEESCLFKISDKGYIFIKETISYFELEKDETFVRYVAGPFSPHIITDKRYYDLWSPRIYENVPKDFRLDEYYDMVKEATEILFKPTILFFWNNGSNPPVSAISFRRLCKKLNIKFYDFKTSKIPERLKDGDNLNNDVLEIGGSDPIPCYDKKKNKVVVCKWN